jgi:hypothetical protein
MNNTDTTIFMTRSLLCLIFQPKAYLKKDLAINIHLSPTWPPQLQPALLLTDATKTRPERAIGRLNEG